MALLIDTVSSAEELAQEWEEIELLVGGGASATVVGEYMTKTVRASDLNPTANYRVVDGSAIPYKHGYKSVILGVSDAGLTRALMASGTDVDRSWLTVAHTVQHGSNVFFSTQGNYTDDPEYRENIALEQRGSVHEEAVDPLR